MATSRESGWGRVISKASRLPLARACAALLLASCQVAQQQAAAPPPDPATKPTAEAQTDKPAQAATPKATTPQTTAPPTKTPQSTTPASTTSASTTPTSTAPATQATGDLPDIEPPPPSKKKGINFKVDDYDITFGGYIKVDLIHDFDDIGDTDAFDVRTIPTTGNTTPGSNTTLHARQTRLSLDVRGPSDEGEIRMYVEGDFFGSGNSFRMRHAYATVKEILAGQTWSTFMDEDAMPETLDFESPVAFPLVRVTQVRWTKPLENKDYFALAVEDPDSEVIAPTGVDGASKNPYPDVVARLRMNNGLGHVQVSAFTGMARFVPDAGHADNAFLWGANLSTKLDTCGKDNAIVQLTYGPGAGRYRGGVTAAPNASGNLEAVPVFGWLTSYQHYWSDVYRSSIGFSAAHADVPDGSPPATSSENLSYSFVNFIWQFTSRAWTGVEFLHGTRETFNGADGDANRVQFSLRFDF